MTTLRYASFHVLSATKGGAGSSSALRKSAHRADFSHVEAREGFLYVRSRAISSRTNDNFDTFPATEIKTAWRSFIGKPVFVNHHNDDPSRARGVIVAAELHEDISPDGLPDTWTEVLMEVDAVRFPKLAKMILDGDIDKTSMGCSVAMSKCSFCGNEAESPIDFCQHIKTMKGRRIQRTTASGTKEAVLVSEICMGISFFENSLLVETPADPTASAFLDPDLNKSHFAKAASITVAPPRSTTPPIVGRGQITGQARTAALDWTDSLHIDSTKVTSVSHPHHEALDEQIAPPKVDTLRDSMCAVCGAPDSLSDGVCQTCGFEEPTIFGDPDTISPQIEDMRDEDSVPFLQCTECSEQFPTLAPEKRAKAEEDAAKAADEDPAGYKTSVLTGYDLDGSAVSEDSTCPSCGEGTLVPGTDEDPDDEVLDESDEDIDPDADVDAEGSDVDVDTESEPGEIKDEADEESDEDESDEDEDKPPFAKKKPKEKSVSAGRRVASEQRYELYVGDGDDMPVAYFPTSGEAFDAAELAGETNFSVVDSHTGDIVKETTTASLKVAVSPSTNDAFGYFEEHWDYRTAKDPESLSDWFWRQPWVEREFSPGFDGDDIEWDAISRFYAEHHMLERKASPRTATIGVMHTEPAPDGALCVDAARTDPDEGPVSLVVMADSSRLYLCSIHAGLRGINVGHTASSTHVTSTIKEKKNMTASLQSAHRRTAVSLTNIGKTDDPLVFKGKDPSGKEVKFKVTEKESADLKAVLYSDMAVNFSGVDVDESEIVKDASFRRRASLSWSEPKDWPGVWTAQGETARYIVSQSEVNNPSAPWLLTSGGLTVGTYATKEEAQQAAEEHLVKGASFRRSASLSAACAPDGDGSSRRTSGINESFWEKIDRQLGEISGAKTVDHVINALGGGPGSNAFFEGSGGDGRLDEALREAGWQIFFVEAPYYFAAKAPNGEYLTYIEGDVMRGDRRGGSAHSSRRRASFSRGPAPAWLNERNNDGYGTPKNHEFWNTVDFEDVNGWRIFNKDGLWYGHKLSQNAWSNGATDKADIVTMADPSRQTDVWASRRTTATSKEHRMSNRRTASATLMSIYADGFGNWHAQVIGGTEAEAQAEAQRAIVEELTEREGPNFAPSAISVVLDPEKSNGESRVFKEAAGKTARRRTAEYYNSAPSQFRGEGFYVLIEGTKTAISGPYPSESEAQFVINRDAIFAGSYVVEHIDAASQGQYDILPDKAYTTARRKNTQKESSMSTTQPNPAAQQRRRLHAAMAIQARRSQAQQERIDILEGVLREVIAATGVRTPKAASLILASEDEHGDGQVATTDEQALPESTDVEAEGKIIDPPPPVTNDDPSNEGGTLPDDGFNKSDDPKSVGSGDGITNESDSERTFTSMRLARLRIEAGVDEGDDLTIGQQIADSTASMDSIRSEVDTLTKVVAKNATREASRPRGVPARVSQTAGLAALIASGNNGRSGPLGGAPSAGSGPALIADSMV